MAIALFGTGMMGSGMAERWLGAGERLNVWNRTLEKTRPLAERGAKVFDDPLAAAQGVQTIHIMLGDDRSVDALLDRILERIPKTTLIIDHTTVSPKGTLARAERAAKAGVEFLHAPVFMSPQACREGTGLMLVSGPQERVRKVEPELKAMTGELWYLGERPEKAAAFKLFGNAMIVTIVAGMADVYTLARSVDVDPREAHELFSHFNPRMSIEIRGKRMAEGDLTSSFDLAMARKDVRLMLETAATAGRELELLPTIARRMEEVIARGFGDKDIVALGIDTFAEPIGAR